MFSSLVKGSGTWDGRLEVLEDEIGKSPLDVLFPSISKTPKTKGGSFYNKSSQSTTHENSHLIPLPKTYLTRKGAIVLFASPNETNNCETREFEKQYCNDCGYPEITKSIRREQSQDDAQSPAEDNPKVFSRPKSMSAFHSTVGCRKNKVRPRTVSGIPSEPELLKAHPRITSAKPTPPTRALGKLPFRNMCSEFEKELTPKLETVDVAHPCSPEAQMSEGNEIKTQNICTTNEQVHYDRITMPKGSSERSQGISRASSASRYWTIDDVTDTEHDYPDSKYPESTEYSARTHRDSLPEAFDMTSRPVSFVLSTSMWEKSSDNDFVEPATDSNLGLPDEMSSQPFLDVLGRPVSSMQGSVWEPLDGNTICVRTEPARDDNNSSQEGRRSKMSSRAFVDVVSRPVSSRDSLARETLNDSNGTYVTESATKNYHSYVQDGPLSKLFSQAFADVVSQPVFSRRSSVPETFSENGASLVRNKMDNSPVVEDGHMSKTSFQVCTSNVPSLQDSVWENSSDDGESIVESDLQDFPSIEDEQMCGRSSPVFYNKHNFYERGNFSNNDCETRCVREAHTGSKDSLDCSSGRDFPELDSGSRTDIGSTCSCARTPRVRSAPCSTKNGASTYSQKVSSRKTLSAGFHKPSPTQRDNVISPTPPATLCVRIPSATSVYNNQDQQEIVPLTGDISERDTVQELAQEDIENHFPTEDICERDDIQELTRNDITDYSSTEDISEQAKIHELTQEDIADRSILNEDGYERVNIQELHDEDIEDHAITEVTSERVNTPLGLNEDEIENRSLAEDISERDDDIQELTQEEIGNCFSTEDISERANNPLGLNEDENVNRSLTEGISERDNILELQQENSGMPESADEQNSVQSVSCVSEHGKGEHGSDEILEDSVVRNDDSVTTTYDQAGPNSLSKEMGLIDGQKVRNDDPDSVTEEPEEKPKTVNARLNETITVLKTDPSGKQEILESQSANKKIPFNSKSLKPELPDKKTETSEKTEKSAKSKISALKKEKTKREGGKLDVQGVGKAESKDIEVMEKGEVNIQNKVDLSDLIEKTNTASKNKKSPTKKSRSPKPSRKKVVSEKVESNLNVIPSVDENLLKFLENQDGTMELTEEALNQFAPVENFQEPDPFTEQEDISTDNTGAYSPSKVKKGTKKEAARKKKEKILERNREADERKKKMAEEKEKREEELKLLQEREEEQRRLLEEANERQKTIQEEKERRLQQEIQARNLEEEAEASLRETRRKAKEDREKRREEEAERRRKEVQRKREEKRNRELEMQKQEQEIEKQRTDRERRMTELRAQREREKELEELAEEERMEEERLRLLELEEEKKLEEEGIREAEEAVQRMIREREYREQMRKIAETQQAKVGKEESERRLREQQESAAIEEQRKRLEQERRERENEERERIRQLRQQEAISRIRAAHEASKRRAWALRRREKNIDRMAHLKSTRQSQKLTDAFTFSYHVHIPRKVWELPYNWNSKKKRGGRSPVRKKKPSEENLK